MKLRLDEKVIITRTNILPKFLYIGHYSVMPTSIVSNFKKLINTLLFDKEEGVHYDVITKKKSSGGLNLIDIPTKLDMIFIKPVIGFLKKLSEDDVIEKDWHRRVDQQIAISFAEWEQGIYVRLVTQGHIQTSHYRIGNQCCELSRNTTSPRKKYIETIYRTFTKELSPVQTRTN